jgi:hypothetical protein
MDRPEKLVEEKSVTIQMGVGEADDDGRLKQPLTEHELLKMLGNLVTCRIGRVLIRNVDENAAPWIQELGIYTLLVTQSHHDSKRWETIEVKAWIVPSIH